MSEVAAAGAGSTSGIPASQGADQGSQQQSADQLALAKQQARPKFESKVEETLWRVNNPTAEETQEVASINSIIDKAQADAAKGSKEAYGDGKTAQRTSNESEKPEAPEQGQEQGSQKEKYVFEGKEIEIDPKDRARYVQKGMLLDKKGYEIAKADRELKAGHAEVQQMKQELTQLLESIKANPFELVLKQQGPEAARQAAEQFLLPHVQREMMDPQERAIHDANERAQRAEQRIAAWEAEQQEAKLNQQAEGFKDQFAKTIHAALQENGVPPNDFTAAEMAQIMSLGLQKDIEYTPQQLATVVKQNNIERVSALNKVHVAEIQEGRKTNDVNRILKAGEALVALHGEPVMYAIGKYYLAKARGGQPPAPKTILDTAKLKAPDAPTLSPKNGKHYVTEDDVKAERMRRVQMLEQGIDPGEWR